MNKREYSTKNIDRILKQANGLVANKRGKNSVLAFKIQYDTYNPADGTVSVIIHEDDILSFNNYVKRRLEERHNRPENDMSDEEYVQYAREGFDHEWDRLAKDFIDKHFANQFDSINSQLQYFKIVVYVDTLEYDNNSLVIEIQPTYNDDAYDDTIDVRIMKKEKNNLNRILIRIAKKYNFEIEKITKRVRP